MKTSTNGPPPSHRVTFSVPEGFVPGVTHVDPSGRYTYRSGLFSPRVVVRVEPIRLASVSVFSSGKRSGLKITQPESPAWELTPQRTHGESTTTSAPFSSPLSRTRPRPASVSRTLHSESIREALHGLRFDNAELRRALDRHREDTDNTRKERDRMARAEQRIRIGERQRRNAISDMETAMRVLLDDAKWQRGARIDMEGRVKETQERLKAVREENERTKKLLEKLRKVGKIAEIARAELG